MKTVILAGGFGTRLSEETVVKPKPLVEIGGRPILWHIMKTFAHYGHKDFIVCLGYKGNMIKEYFSQYFMNASDFTVDLANNQITYHRRAEADWRITLVDTGLETMTGGRIKAVAEHLNDDEPFFMTYGDGVGDVNIDDLLEAHKKSGNLATVTAVTPPGRFGVLDIVGNQVLGFREKIASDQYQINAGYFVLDKKVLDYIDGPASIWEQDPMRSLAADGELNAYIHRGFWKPMDTLRDRTELEKMWNNGEAKWKVWS